MVQASLPPLPQSSSYAVASSKMSNPSKDLTPNTRPVRTVSRRACLNCRERKIKCDGVHICRNCKQLNLECIFVKSHRGGRRNRNKKDTSGIIDTTSASTPTVTVSATNPAATTIPNSTSPSTSSGSFKLATSSSPSTTLPPLSLPPPPLPPSTIAVTNVTSTAQQSQPPPPIISSSPSASYTSSFTSFDPVHSVSTITHQNSSTSTTTNPPQQYSSPYAAYHKPSSYQQSLLQSSLSLHAPVEFPPNSSGILPHHQPYHHHALQPQPTYPPSVLNPKVRKYDSLGSLPYSSEPSIPQTAKRVKLEHDTFDEATRKIVVGQLQNSINDLQTQINALKQFPDQSSLAQKSDSRNLWGNSNRDPDMPSGEIIQFYVDLYYEYFHPNHCFLLPKKFAMKRMSLRTNIALVYAMFSVSCRYADTDPQRCIDVGISPYHKDPMYWADLFEAHRSSLFTTPLVKALLLVGMSFSSGNNHQKSMELADEAYQLCRWNNMDKRFSRNSEIGNVTNPKVLKGLSKTQLVFRESLIRTLWEVWRFRVQVALFNDDPDMVPAFNGDMCLPVSDSLYEQELEGWTFTRVFWSDMDAKLLDHSMDGDVKQEDGSPASPESSFNMAQFDMPVEERERSIYSGSCMSLVCVNLLALVFKHRKTMTNSMLKTLESRLKMLYSKLPPVDQCRVHGTGGYVIAHETLQAATLLLHYDRAISFMVFFTNSGSTASSKNESGTTKHSIELRDAPYLRNLLQTQEISSESCRSYLVCQWAAHCVFKLLGDSATLPISKPVPQSMNDWQEYTNRHQDFWKHLSPVTGFLLHQTIPVLASELVLQTLSCAMGHSLSGTIENFLEYPTFTMDESPRAASMESPLSSPMSGTSSHSSGTLARYSAVDDISRQLHFFMTLEEVMGTVWEKIKGYCESSKWIIGCAVNYEH